MPTFIECKCCEEFPDLLKDKLDDSCITDHKDFDVLCLHNSVLETAFLDIVVTKITTLMRRKLLSMQLLTKNTVFFLFLSTKVYLPQNDNNYQVLVSQNNVVFFPNNCYMVSTRLIILNIVCLSHSFNSLGTSAI